MTAAPVTVVVPCYNGGRFLSETLESVKRQSLAVLEVIVIDDGSTDDSAAIAAAAGTLVRVIRQRNQGESVARNRGVVEAKGAFVALLDADDVWQPNKIEHQWQAIQAAGPEVVCCYTDAYRFEGHRRLDVISRPEPAGNADDHVRLLFDWCVVPSSALIRTDAARQTRFAEEVRRGEDVIFFAELARLGRFHRVPLPLTGYRVSADQQTRSILHGLHSLVAKDEWFERNRHHYSSTDIATFRTRLRDELVQCHERAYWSRQVAAAKECRAAFVRRFPEGPLPALMRRTLYPAWLYGMIDRARKVAGPPSEIPHD